MQGRCTGVIAMTATIELCATAVATTPVRAPGVAG
jgi:hypothetical protein